TGGFHRHGVIAWDEEVHFPVSGGVCSYGIGYIRFRVGDLHLRARHDGALRIHDLSRDTAAGFLCETAQSQGDQRRADTHEVSHKFSRSTVSGPSWSAKQ